MQPSKSSGALSTVQESISAPVLSYEVTTGPSMVTGSAQSASSHATTLTVAPAGTNVHSRPSPPSPVTSGCSLSRT
jgi:hypothetical protein